MNKRAARTWPASRDALIALAAKLERREALEFGDRARLLSLLVQVINEMPPKLDPRVKVGTWQLAMLAAALVDQKGASVKAAVAAAIAFWRPDCQSRYFHENVAKHYRKLRAGQPPRNLPLLPAPKEVVDLAAGYLQTRKHRR